MMRIRSSRSSIATLAIPLLLLASLLSWAPAATAQSTPEPAGSTVLRTITVNGTGTVMVQPDTASVSLGVFVNNASLEEAQNEATRRLGTLTQSLQDAGVAEEDITTSSYNVYPAPKYDRNGNMEGIDHYEVSANLTVVVRDINSVGTILDQATTAGANYVGGVSFFLDDQGPATTQARTAAIEDARGKADEMATASGMVVVNVVSITETSAPIAQERQFEYAKSSESVGAADSSMPVPVSTGQSQVMVTVQVVFEMQQAAG